MQSLGVRIANGSACAEPECGMTVYAETCELVEFEASYAACRLTSRRYAKASRYSRTAVGSIARAAMNKPNATALNITTESGAVNCQANTATVTGAVFIKAKSTASAPTIIPTMRNKIISTNVSC